jgi:hypothetical protein
MGRGEQFYRYNGFTRTVNLAWTVAAQSKQELIPMYQKLNYLASSLTPYYSDTGYMGGNLINLTLGGWFYEQPGILTGMTLSVPQESPWEIAIPSTSNNRGGNGEASDSSVKELPHIIKVTGVQFIPIHNFVPKLQKNTYEGPNYVGTQGQKGKYLNKFGDERYIALSSGGDNNNYDKDNYLQLTNTDTTPKTSVGSLTSKGIVEPDVSITAPSNIPIPSKPKKKKYKALPPLVGEATIDSNVFDQSTLEDQGWRMNQDDLSGDFS